MSVTARILGAVATAALVIVPLATASPAGSATRPSQLAPEAKPMPVGAVSTLGAGTWERLVEDGPVGRRAFSVYTPPGLESGKPVPLVVVLHACTQTAKDSALGAGVNALADRVGLVAVYPEQSPLDNLARCWNWFDPRNQVRGSGEPAEIARITERVLSRPGGATLDRSRVYVMGISAGGSMAVTLGATYPDVYAAVGIHSALEYRAAQSPLAAALAARFGGPNPEQQGRVAHAAMGPRARVVPVIVFQGGADRAVWPVNGDHVVRQWLTTSRLASGAATGLDFGRPQASRVGRAPGGLSYSVRAWNDDAGRPVVQYWTVPGLGHAWSGAAPAGPFADPRGPNATQAMYDFFDQSTRWRGLPTACGPAPRVC
jgi:poly(hydroxyalkanoate) depolymerase family esterase